MSPGEYVFWSTIMMLGFIGSALYSGLETGCYRLNRVRLQVARHHEEPGAEIMHKLLNKRTALLGTLLVGNNVANYFGTMGLGVMLDAQGLGDWLPIVLNTVIVTPLLFVFGETLPKDFFARYADQVMYRLSKFLLVSKWVYTGLGLIPLIQGFTALLFKLMGQPSKELRFHPRREVESLVKEGAGYGLISSDQTAIVQRVLELSERKLMDEITPWDETETLNVKVTPAEVWEVANRSSHARMPVVDDSGEVVGVLGMIDVLIHEPAACPPIAELMQPMTTLNAGNSVQRAIDLMKQKNSRFALVIDPNEPSQPQGIVTLKDLIEAITGELRGW